MRLEMRRRPLIFHVSRLPVRFYSLNLPLSLFTLAAPQQPSLLAFLARVKERRAFLFPTPFIPLHQPSPLPLPLLPVLFSFFLLGQHIRPRCGWALRFKMYAKDRSTPRILTRYTRWRKSSLSLSLTLSRVPRRLSFPLLPLFLIFTRIRETTSDVCVCVCVCV